MVIIHKERVSIPVPEMEPGTVYFDEGGNLLMVTDDKESVNGVVSVVDIKTGVVHWIYPENIAQPLKITTVEVE